MTETTARSETGISEGDAAFAAALHGQLRTRTGNLFYSPATVRMAMTMAWAGARGETAIEMQRAMSLPAGDAAHAGFATLLADWDQMAHPSTSAPPNSQPQMQRHWENVLEQRRVILRVVNRVWAQAGRHVRAEFVTRLRDDYHASLGELDFHRAAETARAVINAWVADATEQKIKALIARGGLTSRTKLVLTNAVYFKAHWREPFLNTNTREAPFFAADGQAPRVPLMRRVSFLPLARLDGALLLELPYGDGRLAMDIVLPTANEGLASVEEAYARDGLRPWLTGLERTHVDVMLPRFHTSSRLELANVLSVLGMPTAFRYPTADFSAIDDTNDLFISSVVHQALVDVDELGTEATAATTVDLAISGRGAGKPVIFRADHPFLFFIRDTQANIMLFAGRLADPTR